MADLAKHAPARHENAGVSPAVWLSYWCRILKLRQKKLVPYSARYAGRNLTGESVRRSSWRSGGSDVPAGIETWVAIALADSCRLRAAICGALKVSVLHCSGNQFPMTSCQLESRAAGAARMPSCSPSDPGGAWPPQRPGERRPLLIFAPQVMVPGGGTPTFKVGTGRYSMRVSLKLWVNTFVRRLRTQFRSKHGGELPACRLGSFHQSVYVCDFCCFKTSPASTTS